MRLTPMLAVLPILALGLLGCGGDDGATKDDFITKADEVCRDLQVEGKQLDQEKPTTPAELTEFGAKARALLNRGIDRFKAIELPKEGADREDAEAYIAQLEKADTTLGDLESDAEKLKQASESKDSQQIRSAGAGVQQSAEEFQDASDEADKLAEAYGMKDCGEDN